MDDKKKTIIGIVLGALFLAVPIGVYLWFERDVQPEEEIVEIEEYNPKFVQRVIDEDSVEYIGPSNVREDKIQAGPTPDSYTVYKVADFEMRYKSYQVYHYEAAEGGSWDKYKVIEGTEEEHVKEIVMREIDGEWVIDSDVNISGKDGEKGPYS